MTMTLVPEAELGVMALVLVAVGGGACLIRHQLCEPGLWLAAICFHAGLFVRSMILMS